MKDTMTKIRALSVEEINKKIADLKEELFNLKFQAALGNIEKPARIGEIKRTIARMKTVITEKENASKVSK
ncbi:MAG: 50S ribosomal protein L29 [Acholeplasmatales bacterium]|jgi:large subunit ribosomal protein L29|nr:50S ribosomal protein L29 [Acholeplasmatales bacterium]MBQ6783600.1 50S ribosomal protein L29 [Acholeplasmatales bacterium]MBR6288889.1 50S ribosomal protein L29 [Acholeplasmatales bacterium]